MSNCENIINPLGLKREGTDQNQRLVAMLKPDSAPIDARTIADDLVFSQQLAAKLKYFGLNNTNLNKQNWQVFFDSDVSVTLALLAVQNVDEYKEAISSLFNQIRSGKDSLGNDYSDNQLKVLFGNLFNLISTLALQIEHFQKALPENNTLKIGVQNLIKTKLAKSFERLWAYYQAAKSNNLIDETGSIDLKIMGQSIEKSQVVFNSQFGKLWTDGTSEWAAYKIGISADDSIYNLTEPALKRRLYFATTHNFFTAIFDQFLRGFTKIVAEANTQLQETLTKQNDHKPHLALFISFLKLLEFARKDANSLTKRHLDLYYKEILLISERKPIPNGVHVVFEAAKFVESTLIQKGTLLNAGKDALGNDLVYSTDTDTVINKAKIQSLSSVYVGTAKDEDLDINPYILEDRVYASPIANSEDGIGGELTSSDKQWHPFAAKKYVDGVIEDITMPKAEIGFAIASHYLYLKEGQRKIIIEVSTNTTLPNPNNLWEAEVTTAEGWSKLAIATSFASNTLVFKNEAIAADFPAIVPYNPEIHGRSFDTTNPIIRFKLKHQISKFQYKAFKNAVIQKIKITVGSAKVKDIYAQNPFGVLDPSKPFLPFGPIPEKDAYFIIGSDEIFQKKNAQINTNIVWQNLPSSINPNPSVRIEKLQAGTWQNVATETNIFDGINTAITIQNDDLSKPNFDGNKAFDVSSRNGFYRFKLNGSFGHAAYQMALTTYLIDKAKGNSDKGTILNLIQAYELPSNTPTAENTISAIKSTVYSSIITPPTTPPYTPNIEEISLSYTATTEVEINDSSSFSNRPLQFFAWYPFGETEQHRKLKDNDLDHETEVYLLPHFKHFNDGDTYFEIEGKTGFVEHEGEFYIGLANISVGQKVAILFQLDEGSANPRIKKPTNHVHWSFLSNNRWLSFQKLEVEDQTTQLTRSGIITFTIPKSATSTSSLLSKNQIWIRASVHEASEAVCKILAVLPQATTAIFKDQGNTPDFLANALPAGSISKLLDPDANIKKVAQPYDSFGGRTQENASDYYKRVAERLRHKDRAITVWDYEHLILEEFTNIYKVKVINHTRYEPNDSGTGIYNELAAGHVTIVTIPNLKNRNAADPLKPYTNVADLEAIDAFISKRKSCFAKIHVQNPIFEEVKVECKVKFYPQFDQTFFAKQLQQDITRFLSPWAFGDANDIKFGGRISKSVIINFIEDRYYVDYLTDFKLYHKIGNTQTDKEEIIATKAISILVSVPFKQHIIVAIPHIQESTANESCGCD